MSRNLGILGVFPNPVQARKGRGEVPWWSYISVSMEWSTINFIGAAALNKLLITEITLCVPPLEQRKFHAESHIQGGLMLSTEAWKLCKCQLLVHVTVMKKHTTLCVHKWTYLEWQRSAGKGDRVLKNFHSFSCFMIYKVVLRKKFFTTLFFQTQLVWFILHLAPFRV